MRDRAPSRPLPSTGALVLATLAALTGLATLVAPAPTAAQQPAARPAAGTPAAPAVTAAFLRDMEAAEQKLVALADAIPEDHYDWRPMEGVRSVNEVIRHVAADNYFIPTALGVAAPAATGIRGDSYPSVQAYEGRATSKEESIADLRASFRHLKDALQATDPGTLGDPVQLFGQSSTPLDLWVLTTTHLHEHLGQLIAYARSNRVVPPWSQ